MKYLFLLSNFVYNEFPKTKACTKTSMLKFSGLRDSPRNDTARALGSAQNMFFTRMVILSVEGFSACLYGKNVELFTNFEPKNETDLQLDRVYLS